MANLATNAVTAGNALSLGSVPAATFARSDVGNAFNGNQSIAGNVSVTGQLSALTAVISGPATIGNGTPINQHLSQTYALAVPAIGPQACAAYTLTMNGASDADSITLGVPNALVNPALTGTGILNYSAWVSAANRIVLRVCNLNPGGPRSNAVSGQLRVDIWKH